MDSHYVGRHLYAAVGQRKYAEARDSEKRKFAMYNYKPPLECRHEMELRPSFGILAAIG